MRPLRQLEAGVADGVPHAVGVEGVLHHAVPDAVAAADAADVAERPRSAPGRARLRRSRTRRREYSERSLWICSARRHLDLAERDGDAERGRGVGDVHRLEGVLGPDVVAAALGVVDGVEREQRGLGLHVVHVGRVGDAGPLHRDRARRRRPSRPSRAGRCPRAGSARSSRSRRRAGARRSAAPRRRATVAKMVACGEMTPSVPPDHTMGICLTSSIDRVPLSIEHLAECAVGDDAGVVVDAAVALGLADDGDDAVGLDDAVVDEPGQPGRVADALDRDLAHLDGLGHDCLPLVSVGLLVGVSTTVPARARARPR